MDVAGYYEDNLNQIHDAIHIICRKYALYDDEANEFSQQVHLQLIENDYRIFRAFKGKSSIKTYLYTVISRMYIDQVRIKWHPSTEAKRMGETAVELEKLVYRNQYAVHEACQMLAANPATAIDEYTARDMLNKLRIKSPRPTLVDNSEDHLPNITEPAPDPETRIIQKQLEKKKQGMIGIIGNILLSLSGEDKLMIKLHFISNRKISEIARLLGKDERMLYKRTQAILRSMREAMAAEGIGEVDLHDILPATGEFVD